MTANDNKHTGINEIVWIRQLVFSHVILLSTNKV